MSDNKNNQGMAENSGSSFDNNPFNNTFTDNNSSFGSDNNTSSGFNESSDFTSSSSFGSSFEVSESNFGSDAGFGSNSDFGSDSGIGSNSDFGSDTEFGSNSDFGSEAGFGSNSDFGSDAGFGSSLDSDSDSGFGSNSDFGSDTGFGNISDSGSDGGFGSNSDFGSDSGFGSNLDFSSDTGFESSSDFGSDSGFGSSANLGSDTGFGTNTTEKKSIPETSYKKNKEEKRSVETELPQLEYKKRIRELNNNATNKHYVLFFGKPASGKTFIIGSIINYLKSQAPGQLIYRDELTTVIEDQLYYKMLDFYQANTTDSVTIGSSDRKQYYEFPFTFIPNNKKCQPIELVFVDCSGEHTQRSMYQYKENKIVSGALPNYLTAILESDVNVKICFVYDYYTDTIYKGTGVASQTNILISAYNEAIHYQRPGEREFSKLMIMSKADMYRNVVDKYGSAEKFALSEVPAFANTFCNEIFETDNSNNFTFYSVGEFYSDSSLKEAKLNFKAPEKIIDWLYRGATGISFVKKEESLLSKIKKMLGF